MVNANTFKLNDQTSSRKSTATTRTSTTSLKRNKLPAMSSLTLPNMIRRNSKKYKERYSTASRTTTSRRTSTAKKSTKNLLFKNSINKNINQRVKLFV